MRSKLLIFFILVFNMTDSWSGTNDSSIDSTEFELLKTKYPLIVSKTIMDYYEPFIKEIENQTVAGNEIMFVGSSTITGWRSRIESDMLPLKINDNGFGGSDLIEQLYYFDRIVVPNSPLILILYCENDILTKPTNQIFDLFKYYYLRFHSKFPESHLYLISLKPSLARKDYFLKFKEVNDLLISFCQDKKFLHYIDVFSSMVDENQNVIGDYLIDGLHLNSKGYDLWTEIIKPVIMNSYCKLKGITDVYEDTSYYNPFLVRYNNSSISISCSSTIIKVEQFDLAGRLKFKKDINIENNEIEIPYRKSIEILVGHDLKGNKYVLKY